MWPLVRFVAITLCIIIIPVKTVSSQDCKFTWDNGTDLTDSGPDIILDRILDTEPPGKQLISVQTENVKQIKSCIRSTSKKPYMEPTLNDNRLILKLAENFVEYEENETSDEMTIKVTFVCLKGTSTIRFIQPIEDTNNHYPEFVDAPYVYTLPMPFPKNFQLTHLQAISARDIDITNVNISFCLDPADPNVGAFSVSWLSKDETDMKRYHATLVTKATINFVQDVTFRLYATDAGNPVLTSMTNVTIKVDRENSVLRFNRPLYTANLTDLVPEEANGKVITFVEGEIGLGSSADKTVKFAIHDDLSDYENNFDLTVADDRSTVSIRLIDPPEKFFLQNFVVLSLTAKTLFSQETTVLHISLPGREFSFGTSTTTSPSENLDCKFTWDNGMDFPDNQSCIPLEQILDTNPPGTELLSVQAKNVKSITKIISSSLNGTLYMQPTLGNDRLILKLTDAFAKYEEIEFSNEMSVTVTFECLKGTLKEIEFSQGIEDTNNHSPEFINDPYVYTLPMPFPKNFELNHLQAISARDIDLTNANISFSLDPEEPNASAFSVSWLSRDKTDLERHHATLVTEAVINFTEDVNFTLYATDTGTPSKTSETKITIKVDTVNSIPRFKRPLYTADLAGLIPEEANGKVITFSEGEISLGSGADKTVNFTIHDDLSDYENNFNLTVADNRSTVSLRLTDPPEKFFLESFVVLSLTAKKSASEETTVLHISLPGRASVPGSSTTSTTTESSGNVGPTCPEQEECDNTDYVVAIVILAILLLTAIAGLVVSVLKIYRTRRVPFKTEQTTNGGQHVLPEMEEIRNSSASPNYSLDRPVAFNGNAQETNIEKL